MKKLFSILLMTVLVLTSCEVSLQPSNNNTDYTNIIGKSIRIGNLEIAQYDFPETMNWGDGKKACEALGNGWRLPTKDELNLMFENKDKIGVFSDYPYWGSAELDGIMNMQYFHFFIGNEYTGYKNNQGLVNQKYNHGAIRAVRSL
jgi:hypothetical protein